MSKCSRSLIVHPSVSGESRWRRGRAIVACFCAVVANFTATQALSAAHYLNSGYWGASPSRAANGGNSTGPCFRFPFRAMTIVFLVNKPTLDMAESFSEDLHNMNACLKIWRLDIHPRDYRMTCTWAITGCLPGKNSPKNMPECGQYPPIFSMAPASVILNWRPLFWDLFRNPPCNGFRSLPSSVVRVAKDAVRIPCSTRVAQNSWREELFDRALLRRTALVAAGENPEVFGYQSFIKIIYTVLWRRFSGRRSQYFSSPGGHCSAFPRALIEPNASFIAFALSVMMIDVLCRLSFYSFVNWILWDLRSPLYTRSTCIDCRHCLNAPDCVAVCPR